MGENSEKKVSADIEEKRLPSPDEKLLRKPTFFEKHSRYRLLIGVVIVAMILLAGWFMAPSRFIQSENDENINILNTPSNVTEGEDIANKELNMYVSKEGKFSLEYPKDYQLEVKDGNKGIVQLMKLDRSGNYFKLLIESISLPKGVTLEQAIKSNPICGIDAQKIQRDILINNSLPAKIFTDLDCLTQGKTLLRTVSDIGSETRMYTFIVDSPLKFEGFKGQLDDLISKFQVVPEPSSLIPEEPDSFMDDSIYCDMDAQQCPDGSWVGRTGPKCEFVCSGASASAPDKPVDLNSGM